MPIRAQTQISPSGNLSDITRQVRPVRIQMAMDRHITPHRNPSDFHFKVCPSRLIFLK